MDVFGLEVYQELFAISENHFTDSKAAVVFKPPIAPACMSLCLCLLFSRGVYMYKQIFSCYIQAANTKKKYFQ